MWDRGQVKSYMSANCLHGSRNGFTISQYFVQILCAQNVAQRRLSQKSSRMMGVFNVGHRNGRVRHAKINHGVHRHRHAVLGQHLPGFFCLNLFISQFNHNNKWIISQPLAVECQTLPYANPLWCKSRCTAI
jgi:hypothetical protein